MAEAVIEDQDPLRCSVCLELLKDPVTCPCGHSYCMKCISGCWDQEDQRGEYSCPQCRETFTTRPVLKKNTILAELVEKIKSSASQTVSPTLPASYAEPGDVECDFCIERKLTAVKSCLVCLVSLCQTHIEPHNSIPALKNHKLVQASTRLEERICPQHSKLMEVFCRTDQKCICMLCTMDDHKGHDAVFVAVERKEREQNELDKTRAEYLKRIQKTEQEVLEMQEAVASHQRSAQEAEQQSEKIFTELLESIERRRSEVKELIRAQQKAAVRDAEDVLEKLEQELAELRRGHAQLEKLSVEEDHVLYLQSFQVLKSSVCKPSPSNTLSPHMSFEDLSKSLVVLKSEVEELCKHVIKLSGEGKCCSGDILSWFMLLNATSSAHLYISLVTSVKMPDTREDFLKYSCALTLDPNTPCRLISLSEGNKRATFRKEKQLYPDHPDRLTEYAQVLCEQGFRRRVYWEVEVELDLKSEESYVEIAIAYKSIKTVCDFRDDEKSWVLYCETGKCSFWHCNKETAIPIAPTSTIGVYVDHRAGILSFYSVSDKMTLLHKVRTSFTEPIYPGFYLYENASVKLLS
ncbi:tripartite motif-containing protein 16-like [Engraulis encrasicolus]|uniref:tripartite motif-containing protein 16-like n=1 Tax=Engraulis encrasicolus TaxID=184585 RepID=UPI002FD6D8D7